MSTAGYFRGTTAQQDARFADKKKKLMKTMKFAEGLDRKVDMAKVNVDSIKPWIAQRLTELLGMDDDVIVELVYNYLEEPRSYYKVNGHQSSIVAPTRKDRIGISPHCFGSRYFYLLPEYTS